ncbi:MAG TPA: FtsX-like permease family protein [Actinomycetota bacterium]|nr:FtsX-like permease family protein [Actinomycetota bacterium]
MSPILFRKLRRDVWRQRMQFAAVVVVVAIGVTVFVAATDAYRNLNDSFATAYERQRLPDVVVTGQTAPSLAASVSRLPGDPSITVRTQGEIGARIGQHSLLARIVGIPAGGQPAVSRIAVRSGRLPGPGEVLVEQHLADHFGLSPGSTIALLGPDGWRTVTVSGSGLSSEYLWPARSQQELMTSPEQFGVAFAPERLARELDPSAQNQLVVYAGDREQVDNLVTETTRLARGRGLVVTLRSDLPSYVALDQDVQTFGEFANLLPLLFLVAGMLGAFILLSRMVSAQRAIIGTLSANGMAPRTLRRHYLGFGVAAGAAAIPPGLIGGVLLGVWFTTRYTDALGLPLHTTSLHPRTLILAACASIITTSFAAWGPARVAARTTPAAAMRTTPPGRGRRSIFERLVPPLRRLPARWRMVVRGLGRNRRRAGFTIVGVAVSLSLVLVFAGLRDTVANVLDRQYGQIDRSDGQLIAAPGLADRVIEEARSDEAVIAAEPFARVGAALTAGDHRFDTLIVGLPAGSAMHRFLDMDGRQIELAPEGGLLLGRGLTRLLSVGVGGSVTVTVADGTRFIEPVVGTVDEPLTATAYVALGHLESLLGRSVVTGAFIKLAPGVDRDQVAHHLGGLPGVAAYVDNAAAEATMRDAFGLMDVLVGVMLTFAIVMAIALLFNAMSANVAERSVELGTLNAAGMPRGILGRLVAAENLLLTVIGTLIGLVSGTLLARWFMSNYENLGYRWELRMQVSTIIVVVLAFIAASVLSQLPVRRRLRHIDVAMIVRERSL